MYCTEDLLLYDVKREKAYMIVFHFLNTTFCYILHFFFIVMHCTDAGCPSGQGQRKGLSERKSAL